jgi:hypothetical protein
MTLGLIGIAVVAQISPIPTTDAASKAHVGEVMP